MQNRWLCISYLNISQGFTVNCWVNLRWNNIEIDKMWSVGYSVTYPVLRSGFLTPFHYFLQMGLFSFQITYLLSLGGFLGGFGSACLIGTSRLKTWAAWKACNSEVGIPLYVSVGTRIKRHTWETPQRSLLWCSLRSFMTDREGLNLFACWGVINSCHR